MNDRYDAGYGSDQQYELVGYDEYGQPVYRQVPPQQPPQQPYDPYAQQGYGYDPYATGQQQPVPPYEGHDPYEGRTAGHDPYGAGGTAAGYDPYGPTAASGQQPRVAEQTAYIPQQAGPAEEPEEPRADERDYRTGQFAFVEEPDGDSEDVIDWLAFTENRTERREEARRRARSRIVALVVVMALCAVGGVGYLWYAGKLPGLSSSDEKTGTTTAVGAQKRDVVVVHLHDTRSGDTATALLVDNTTTEQGTTVLLPNSLSLTGDDGTTTTLAKSVEDDGSAGTREALDTVLGTEIQGTWRLDTPYLQNLVDLVGNIDIDTDTDVPDPSAKKSKGAAPLVTKGEAQTLSGKMAVAYATYRGSGEAQNAQLQRFGQVMQGVLRKLSSDAQAATVTVQTLQQILDPSMTDKDLGTFLAQLADLAKGGDHRTALLPVQGDGTLSAETSASVVKDVLGGTAKSPDQGAAVRVSLQNATGVKDNTEKARVVLLNGGFTFLDGGTAGAAQAASKVVYTDAGDKADATEVAKTLGLPTSAVSKGKTTSNANVSVILGQDYAPSS
ncbi:LytR C-terminal domain-containing protein [Streptomyces sp. NPDC000983]|uniref:LCP family protein n=1 Tax=Streptomyces sp. NPDC000983 TaxID=3154373 RepID=UPI00332432D4